MICPTSFILVRHRCGKYGKNYTCNLPYHPYTPCKGVRVGQGAVSKLSNDKLIEKREGATSHLENHILRRLMSRDTTEKDEELQALRKEVSELQKYKDAEEFKKSVNGQISIFGIRVWAGPELNRAFANFLKKEKSKGLVPVEETADLAAAVVKRIIHVGMITLCLALVPSILLFWQNLIMKDQNASLIQQIEAQRDAQIAQQVSEFTRMLLSENEAEVSAAKSFFYSGERYAEEGLKRMASLAFYGSDQSRCDALNIIANILKARKRRQDIAINEALSLSDVLLQPEAEDMTFVVLQNLSCSELDFSGINLGNIRFVSSKLKSTNFTHSFLPNVAFIKSDLSYSRFRGAYVCKYKSDECIEVKDSSLKLTDFNMVQPLTFPKEFKFPEFDNVSITGMITNSFDEEFFKNASRKMEYTRNCVDITYIESCRLYHISKQGKLPDGGCPGQLEEGTVLSLC